MGGFITIERGIWDHPLFRPEPMTEREAWMWMIAQAAWSNTRHRVGSRMVDVPRGSLMVTLRELQSAFMWKSDKKVRSFLASLEREEMIEKVVVGQRNAPKTHVTICNYEEYQSSGRTKDADAPNGAKVVPTGRTEDTEKIDENQAADAPKTHQRRTGDAVKKQINKITNKDTNVSSVRETLLGKISPDVADEFIAHRAELKKPLTERAARAIMKKIEGHPDPDGVLTDSIANGWQGVFPEKHRPKLKTINGGHYENSKPDPTMDAIAIAARMRRSPGALGHRG